jgi:hypothetical protein
MKIATKALTTLLIVTIMTAGMTGGASALSRSEAHGGARLERLHQHHDRKLELRASILGMNTDELRNELKERSFDKVLKKHGFKSREAFHKAMVGKLKDELMRRGWSEKKIEQYVKKRVHRMMQ